MEVQSTIEKRKSADKKLKISSSQDSDSDSQEEEESPSNIPIKEFSYLVNMPMMSLTLEKVEKLQKEVEA